jgi:hypothetical protein
MVRIHNKAYYNIIQTHKILLIVYYLTFYKYQVADLANFKYKYSIITSSKEVIPNYISSNINNTKYLNCWHSPINH